MLPTTKASHFTSFNPKNICLSLVLLSWFVILLLWISADSSQCQLNSCLPPERIIRPVCQENSSVYIYPLPEKFNVGLLDDCRHLNVHTNMCPHVANKGLGQPFLNDEETAGNWYATNQFMSEMLFHTRMKNHPCRTLDPMEATLFYVPFYGGLHSSSKFCEPDYQARDALAVEFSNYIQGMDWLARRDGRDHFLVLGRIARDFMRDPNLKGGSRKNCGSNILLNLLPTRNMSVLIVERDPWQGKNQHGIPYPSYFHPTTVSEMLKWQEKVNWINRSNLFSFIGAPRTGSRGALREKIIQQCDQSTRCELVMCGLGVGKCYDPKEVMRTMMRSEFCLQPPGDSSTRRSTFDAIVAGCIPVFFSRHTAYTQYGWYLPEDPGDYSVYLEEGRNSSVRIEKELVKIPAERVARMRRKVVDLIPKISYMHPNASGSSGFRDAVDIALSALSYKVLNSL